jgi:hypothetical protein
MSYADAPGRWSEAAHNGLDNLPRLVLLAAIVLAWATTLSWPPPPADFQPRVDKAEASNPDYILRIPLPASEPVEEEELTELVKQHKSLARLDLGLPTLNEGEFADAFSGLLSPTPKRDVTPLPGLAPGEMLDLDYDLATLEPVAESFDRSDGSLTVRKPLFVDGVSSGSATIRIEEGAQILIATSAVARALGEKTERLPSRISGALAQGNGFIPFYELRGAGVAVEYDPVSDRISLSTPS